MKSLVSLSLQHDKVFSKHMVKLSCAIILFALKNIYMGAFFFVMKNPYACKDLQN